MCIPERFKISLEEGFAAAPHDGGLALGGMRRLCIAGKWGKEGAAGMSPFWCEPLRAGCCCGGGGVLSVS